MGLAVRGRGTVIEGVFRCAVAHFHGTLENLFFFPEIENRAFAFSGIETCRYLSVHDILPESFRFLFANKKSFIRKKDEGKRRLHTESICAACNGAAPAELLAEARSRQSVRLSGTVCFAAATFILRLGNDLHIYKPSELTPSPDRFEAAIYATLSFTAFATLL